METLSVLQGGDKVEEGGLGVLRARFGGGGAGMSVCGSILAVRGHEDDRLGCHSRPLFLIGGDVPRWTSAQPGSLWLPALPVHSNANTNRTISCFRRGSVALWHQAPALVSFGCRSRVFRAFLEGTAPPLCVFHQEKAANKSLQNFNVLCQRDRQPSPSRIDECLLIIH